MTMAQWDPTGGAVVGIAAADGFVIAVMVSAHGHISGGHFNPTVSTGLPVTRTIKPADWATYVVVQLVSATVAALALTVLYETVFKDATGLGTPSLAAGYTSGQGLLLEGILTYFLVFTVFAVAVDGRGAFKIVAGLPIGFATSSRMARSTQPVGSVPRSSRATGRMVACTASDRSSAASSPRCSTT